MSLYYIFFSKNQPKGVNSVEEYNFNLFWHNIWNSRTFLLLLTESNRTELGIRFAGSDLFQYFDFYFEFGSNQPNSVLLHLNNFYFFQNRNIEKIQFGSIEQIRTIILSNFGSLIAIPVLINQLSLILKNKFFFFIIPVFKKWKKFFLILIFVWNYNNISVFSTLN